MNKILVPTDFSDNATQALRYAVMLAQKTGVEIILLNVYENYIPITGTLEVSNSYELVEESCKSSLTELAKEFIPANVKYTILTAVGRPVNAIAQIAEENKVDLVVMGIRGCNKLQQIIMGSTATALIRTKKKPVFVIPKNAATESPDKILFAFDGKEIPAKETMQPLKDIALTFNAEVLTLNVINDMEAAQIDKRYIARETYHALSDTNYSVNFKENEDVLQAINKFIKEHEVKAVAMIYHSHSFFDRIFMESRAHKMAFYTNKPLIILQDNEEE
jgi:nucleotide-binding universal stress UspA family protein